MLDEAVKGDEVKRGVEVVTEDIGLNVVVMDIALLGEVDGFGVGVEPGGLYTRSELAQVRAGTAADLNLGSRNSGTDSPSLTDLTSRNELSASNSGTGLSTRTSSGISVW